MKSHQLIWTEMEDGSFRAHIVDHPGMTVALIDQHGPDSFRLVAAFQSDLEDKETFGTVDSLKDAAQWKMNAFADALAPDRVPFDLAKEAVKTVLNALANDPRKFWLMGDLTDSFESLVIAQAAITGKTEEEIRDTFRPSGPRMDQYIEEKNENEELLRHCRENGITVEA